MNHPTKITAAVPCGTAPASQAPVGVGATYSPCPNCEGTGFFTAGAFHPDDPRCEATWDCEDCQGTGEVESDTHCQCGEPLDDDLWCPSCEMQYRIESGQLVDVEVWHIENGRFGVGA